MMAYNSERFIANAIESCLNQTYKDIEICISDDGSTDETVKIIEDYQKKNRGIIKIHKFDENQGVISLCINANKAKSLCSGEYMAIMDPDEYMDPNRIQKQYEFLKNNNDYIAVSHVKTCVDYFENTVIKEDNKNRVYGDVSSKDLILYGNLFSSCFMMRNKPEMQFNTRLKVMGDWEFIIRMSLIGKLYIDNENLTYKWMHDTNVTRTKNDDIRMDEWITLSSLAKEFKSIKLFCYLKMGVIEIRKAGIFKAAYGLIKIIPVLIEILVKSIFK